MRNAIFRTLAILSCLLLFFRLLRIISRWVYISDSTLGGIMLISAIFALFFDIYVRRKRRGKTSD